MAAIAMTIVPVAAMAAVPAAPFAVLHLLDIAGLRSAGLGQRHGNGRRRDEGGGEHGDGHGSGKTALDRCLHVDLP